MADRCTGQKICVYINSFLGNYQDFDLSVKKDYTEYRQTRLKEIKEDLGRSVV